MGYLLAAGIFFIPSGRNEHTRYRWEKEYRASYDFRLATDVQYGPQARKRPFHMVVSGTLNMRVLDLGETHTVGFALGPVLVTADGGPDELLQQLFATPFTVAVDTAGLFKEFHFPAALAPQDREMLAGLLRSMEMVILPDHPRKLYTVKQEDGLGTYIATYRHKNTIFKKEKKNYLTSQATRPASIKLPYSVTIRESHYSFQPDADGCWIHQLTGEERLSVLFEHNQFKTASKSSITLSKLSKPVAHSILWSGIGLNDWIASPENASGDQKRSVEERRVDQKLDDELKRSGPDKDNSELVTTPVLVSGIIVDNIRAEYPEIAATLNQELVSRLETSENNKQVSYLLHALGDSQDESNGEVIAGFIDSTDMRVRENAAETLARFDDPDINSLLVDQLKTESEDVIKTQILTASRNTRSKPSICGSSRRNC